MLNRSKAEAEDFIRENTGKLTTKEIGAALNVSGARVSQMRGQMKGLGTIVELGGGQVGGDQVTPPEAA